LCRLSRRKRRSEEPSGDGSSILPQARTQAPLCRMRAEKRSTIRLAGVMAMALVVVPGVASARPPEAADVPLAQTLQGPAKDAYSSAGPLFNNGDFAGAFTKYRAAYDLAKDPRLLYDMALLREKYSSLRADASSSAAVRTRIGAHALGRAQGRGGGCPRRDPGV
jgi:hypothetical protein